MRSQAGSHATSNHTTTQPHYHTTNPRYQQPIHTICTPHHTLNVANYKLATTTRVYTRCYSFSWTLHTLQCYCTLLLQRVLVYTWSVVSRLLSIVCLNSTEPCSTSPRCSLSKSLDGLQHKPKQQSYQIWEEQLGKKKIHECTKFLGPRQLPGMLCHIRCIREASPHKSR